MQHIKRGWQYVEGFLVKGQVHRRPSEVMPRGHQGEIGWNPATDAFPVRLGATFIGGGRYRLGPHIMDANGAFLDPAACPECGSLNGEYKWQVRVESRNPRGNPWDQAWTYCRRCCTSEEVERLRQQLANPTQARQPVRNRQ